MRICILKGHARNVRLRLRTSRFQQLFKLHVRSDLNIHAATNRCSCSYLSKRLGKIFLTSYNCILEKQFECRVREGCRDRESSFVRVSWIIRRRPQVRTVYYKPYKQLRARQVSDTVWEPHISNRGRSDRPYSEKQNEFSCMNALSI